MPTFRPLPRFLEEYADLTPQQAAAFARTRKRFVDDLRAGRPPRPGLRVRQLATHPGVYEITWASDGRATFHYGEPVRPGHLHVIWRRIGGHEIFDNP